MSEKLLWRRIKTLEAENTALVRDYEQELKRSRLRVDVLVATANRLASELVQAKGLTGKEATAYIDNWGDR